MKQEEGTLSVSELVKNSHNGAGPQARVPRLDEEPELVKFCRVEPAQYEGDWAPDKFDPRIAQRQFDSTLEEMVEADEMGLDGVMTTEHHFDAWTMIPSPNVFLAAVARETRRLRLGQSVNVLTIHNPWRLAEEFGMIDMLSDGRAEIGVGIGNFSVERTRYTPELDEFDDRYEANLELLEKALYEENVTFEGKYNRMTLPSTIYPKPFDPESRRLWIPGMRPEGIEQIAKSGHNLYGFMLPGGYEGNFNRYIEAAEEAGLERSGANYMLVTSVICTPEDREAEEIKEKSHKLTWEDMMARRLPEEEAKLQLPIFGGDLCGSPKTVLDMLEEGLKLSGARRSIILFRMRGYPDEIARQSQRLFCEEVMPRLRHMDVSTSVAAAA